MKLSAQILSSAGLMVLVGVTSTAFAEDLTVSRTIEETLQFSGDAPGRLIVDNIFGSVRVYGHRDESVVVVAVETRIAETEQGLERSKREVDLKIFERAGEIELFVDGPFRCREGRHGWPDRQPTYRVQYDFEIRVPSATSFTVKTVNDGDIEISDVRGDFQVSNVNGSVRLDGLAGSGEIETVNGEIWARFAVNPTSATRFITVNGEVDARFQPDLSADLELKARWGEMWSEYPVEAGPGPPPSHRTEKGRTVIELDSGSRVRVGTGGPTLYFETLNGDIFVRRSTI